MEQLIEDKVNSFPEAAQCWIFNETPVLSTYLFAICAGPFEKIECPE